MVLASRTQGRARHGRAFHRPPPEAKRFPSRATRDGPTPSKPCSNASNPNWGRVDVLVNNAATNPYFGPAIDATEAVFDKTFEVNVKGYFLMAQRAAPRDGEAGQKVRSSTSRPSWGDLARAFPGNLFHDQVHRDHDDQGVREGTWAGPACAATPSARASPKPNSPRSLIDTKEIYDTFVQRIPSARHAQPSEIVGAALYLASDASSYTTGTILPVDGGLPRVTAGAASSAHFWNPAAASGILWSLPFSAERWPSG